MIAVIDARVALKWFIEEDGSAQATALLTGPHTLIAPDLIIAEVANAGWKAVRSGGMTREQHDHAAARLPLAFDHLIPLAPLAPRAVAISRDLDHPVYDCFYLALAEDRHATLVTADGRLLNRLRGTQWAPLGANLHTMPPES
ncbi:type II toxin-antitoxin system VapC family toxin [Rhodopila globiformis]|uniref:type II toxin-antitoxin system VapC family toxin n=1 Tax=Rhodopila globiformis TaxID=1071 RepID=UPI001304DD5F|nr:type II toxin-antitoxin system VapC family toxin [Rhodopila globiformis]